MSSIFFLVRSDFSVSPHENLKYRYFFISEPHLFVLFFRNCPPLSILSTGSGGNNSLQNGDSTRRRKIEDFFSQKIVIIGDGGI